MLRPLHHHHHRHLHHQQHHHHPPATIDALASATQLNHHQYNHYDQSHCLRNHKGVPFELVNYDLEEQEIASCCHQVKTIGLKTETN
jgi:hypothetical protein